MSNNKLKSNFLIAYQMYEGAIFRHCYFRIYNKEQAEELVQETFMKVWQYLLKGNEIENIKAFLYRVANNLVIDRSRKKKEESLEMLMEKSPNYEPSYEGSKSMENKLMYDGVVEKMNVLPADYKKILKLRYINDLYPKDIAELLNTTANNVSVKINRALKILKTELRA